MKKLALTKILFLFFFVSILSVSGLSQKEMISSRWASNQINIDGRSDDWKDEAFHFEKKLGVDYSFKNDAENLFILFVFKDPRYLSSINDTGMTIWFNLEGKKKKNKVTYGRARSTDKVRLRLSRYCGMFILMESDLHQALNSG